jgi:threonyl-tRNA synthetase
VPYILVVGDKEMAENAVSVREHGKGDRGKLEVAALLSEMHSRVESRG